MLTTVYRLVRRRVSRAPRLHDQVVSTRTVGTEVGVEHPFILLCWLEEDTGGSVTEERAGSPVCIVCDGRHLLSSDDEDALVAPRADIVRSCLQSIDEARAGCLHVEGESVHATRLIGDDRCCRGEVVVGGICR